MLYTYIYIIGINNGMKFLDEKIRKKITNNWPLIFSRKVPVDLEKKKEGKILF